MRLLLFELKKMWRRKQLLVLAFFTVICVIGIFVRNVSMQEEIVNQAMESLSTHSMAVHELSSQYSEAMATRSHEEKFLESYENFQTMTSEFRNWMEDFRAKDWDRVPEAENAFMETILKHMEFGGGYTGYKGNSFSETLEKNMILLELSLPYEHDTYSLSSPNFMKSVFTSLLGLPALIFLALLFSGHLITETENNTIRTLYTQPVRKWQLLLGKFASMMVAVFVMLFLVILSCLIIPPLFGGQSGSFSYPQLILHEDNFVYSTIGHYLFKHVLLFLGTASFTFSIVLLFSTLLRHRLSILISTLLVLIGGAIITNQITLLQTGWNPLYYYNFRELIERPDSLGHFSYILILFLFSIILLSICVTLVNNIRPNSNEKHIIRPFRLGTPLSSNQFISMFVFEWRKLWRQGVMKQLVVIILLLIVGSYLLVTYMTNNAHNKYRTTIEYDISHQEQLISDFQQIIESRLSILDRLKAKDVPLTDAEEFLRDQSKAEVIGYQKTVSGYLEVLERKRNELIAFQKEDWSSLYGYWIEDNKIWQNSSEYIDNRLTKRVGGGLSEFTYEASIQEKEWLTERQLEPVLVLNPLSNGMYVWTVHDRFLNPLDQLEWRQETQKIDKTGLFYAYTFFDSYSYLILIGLLLFLFGAGFTTEKGIKRTLTFLHTQPIARTTVFFGKTGVSIAGAFSIAFLSILLMVLLGTVWHRFGDWAFPVLYYDSPKVVESAGYKGTSTIEGGFHFIEMGKYLLETSLLFLMIVVLLVTLALFISLFLSNMISALMLTLVIAVCGYSISTISGMASIAHLSPFTYLNVGKIANGETAAILANESIQTMHGLFVLIVSTLVLVGTGMVVFRNRHLKVF